MKKKSLFMKVLVAIGAVVSGVLVFLIFGGYNLENPKDKHSRYNKHPF
ncbi:MAG: hypothetical protein FWD97_01345 [Defluviitaleaceae bacterium]|nr:hypothetical protein [Defluviitaleaceae bacterium]